MATKNPIEQIMGYKEYLEMKSREYKVPNLVEDVKKYGISVALLGIHI
jgi:hypothetical protein